MKYATFTNETLVDMCTQEIEKLTKRLQLIQINIEHVANDTDDPDFYAQQIELLKVIMQLESIKENLDEKLGEMSEQQLSDEE